MSDTPTRFNADKLGIVVIKIGTALLSGPAGFNGTAMEPLVQELCALKQRHHLHPLIVTSGAVGVGMRILGMDKRPTELRVKQAVAAVGQSTLMHYYETLFRLAGGGDLCTAQVLLSWADLADRRSYLNVRNTLHTLFDLERVIPIINENDSTATEEFRFGENDSLAAKIAAKLGAGLLIILTDVDGLYDKHPGQHEDARLIAEVPAITPELEAAALGAGTLTSTGGMKTKLAAARIATAAGVPAVIACGRRPGVLQGVLDGTVPRTHFHPAHEALPHRKRWIAFGQGVQGAIIVDAGAERALVEQGRSLLPIGITGVEGEFGVGACVRIVGPEGKDLARALVNYPSGDLRKIQGRHGHEIEALLGYKDHDEVAHRDNLVVL